MSLSRQDVEQVSLLARLRLSEEELSTMTEQLGKIVGYVEQLQALDVTNVAPMAHAVEMQNVFRPDVVQPSLERDAALGNAPKQDGEFFLVPPVMGE